MAIGLGIAAVALATVGTGLSVYSAIQQGKAAEDQAKFQEDIANNQAIQSRQNAEFEARQIARRNKLVLGRQRAAAAKSGVLISGSVSDVIEDSTIQGELDRLTALYRGDVQATGASASAKLAGMSAENIRRNTLLTAAGTGLSGAASIASAGSKLPSFNTQTPQQQSVQINGWNGPTSYYTGSK